MSAPMYVEDFSNRVIVQARYTTFAEDAGPERRQGPPEPFSDWHLESNLAVHHGLIWDSPPYGKPPQQQFTEARQGADVARQAERELHEGMVKERDARFDRGAHGSTVGPHPEVVRDSAHECKRRQRGKAIGPSAREGATTRGRYGEEGIPGRRPKQGASGPL